MPEHKGSRRFRDSDGNPVYIWDRLESEQSQRQVQIEYDNRVVELYRKQHAEQAATLKARTRAQRLVQSEYDNRVVALSRKQRAEQAATLKARDLIARRARAEIDAEITSARRAGLNWRNITVALPAVVANGAATVGLWIPSETTLVRSIDVAYLTAPSSALGTIVLDIKKVEGATTTLLQDAAGFDLEALAAGVPGRAMNPSLAKATRTLQGAYVYALITSDNADAVDGTGGALTISYQTCK